MKQKKIKLSPTQKEIVALLQTGEWEIVYSNGLCPRGWMQKGGLGRDGQSKDINVATFQALYNKCLIKQGEWSFPTIPYHLTELGKTIKLD